MAFNITKLNQLLFEAGYGNGGLLNTDGLQVLAILQISLLCSKLSLHKPSAKQLIPTCNFNPKLKI